MALLVVVQASKTAQYTDIPTKIIKENLDLVLGFIFSNFNDCIAQSVCPTTLKLVDFSLIRKKHSKNSKENYTEYRRFQKFVKSLCLIKFQCGFGKRYSD